MFPRRKMKSRADLPHALFLCAIGGWTLWYLLDARAASSDIQNLGLIAPVALAVIVLCGIALIETGHAEPRAKLPWPAAKRILGTMSLLGAYVLTMDRIGFDVATWLYVLANLIFLGERRIWMLAAAPLGFTALVIYAFSAVLRTPLPLLFGGGA